MYCDRRGNEQKPTRAKPPGQKPSRTIEIEFVQGLLSGIFVLGLLKSGGPRCVTYFRGGVPGCVTKCDRGGGEKLAKNSVTYFMDGPIDLDSICVICLAKLLLQYFFLRTPWQQLRCLEVRVPPVENRCNTLLVQILFAFYAYSHSS